MSRGRKLQTGGDFNRSLRNKYGLGEGENYKPWLRVQDVKSQGVKSQIWGRKTGREHHFLSSVESQFFYLAEFSQSVIDIREQFPLLPINLSQKIAKTLGVKHPTIPAVNEPNIMTTDFLLTCERNNQRFYKAISVKPEKELDQRSAEKIDIERIWWELLGIEFSLFTGNELTKAQSCNIRWASAPFRSGLSFFETSQVETALSLISEGKYILPDICEEFNGILGQHSEGGLNMLRYLIAEKLIVVDLSHSIEYDGALEVFSVNDKIKRAANDY